MPDSFPIPYYLAWLLAIGLGLRSWYNRGNGLGIPSGAVLATTCVWYLGDALYNDYSRYVSDIGRSSLEAAWWQVCVFLAAFGVLVPIVSRTVAAKLFGRPSSIVQAVHTRWFDTPEAQHRLEALLPPMVGAYIILMGIALVRVDFDFQGLFMPYLGYQRHPWLRGRMGGGFDALLSLAAYFQIFLTAGFGVLAALLRSPRYRAVAVCICLLAFPYYVFGRTRNTMLATLLPGFLAWVFVKIRGSVYKRTAVIAGGFLLLSFWFAFVLSSRTESAVSRAFSQGVNVERISETHHLGLNMLEELGWINYFMEEGTYRPNWGERYFAEIVNPIPRSLWPEKPLIGIDYAEARGQGGGGSGAAGVHATISTGMIGQGVVNFGAIFGPIAAAFLMALWVGVLARQDLIGTPARQLLYTIGLILTFNMGRDITLLVLYPFIFGYLAIRVIEMQEAKRMGGTQYAPY